MSCRSRGASQEGEISLPDPLPAAETDRLTKSWRSRARWSLLLQLAIILLAFSGAYLLWRDLDHDGLRVALTTAERGLLILTVLLVTANLLVKSLRWQTTFVPPEPKPTYDSVLSAFSLGVLANSIVPLRLGEVVRLTVINKLARVDLVRGAGTIAIEKTFEAMTLLSSGLLLLPFISLPEAATVRVEWLAVFFGLVTILLFAGAYLGSQAVKRRSFIALGEKWPRIAPLGDLLTAAVRSLSVLRRPRRIGLLALLSAVSIALAVATPLLLFNAFDLSLGLTEAVAMNLVVSLGLIPPSTPGKLVVFEALALIMLQRFGVTNMALGVGYAVTYHLVVLLPQLLLGAGTALYVGRRLEKGLPTLLEKPEDG